MHRPVRKKLRLEVNQRSRRDSNRYTAVSMRAGIECQSVVFITWLWHAENIRTLKEELILSMIIAPCNETNFQ